MKGLYVLGLVIDLAVTVTAMVLVRNYFLGLSELAIVMLPVFPWVLTIVATIGMTIAISLVKNLI